MPGYQADLAAYHAQCLVRPVHGSKTAEEAQQAFPMRGQLRVDLAGARGLGAEYRDAERGYASLQQLKAGRVYVFLSSVTVRSSRSTA